MDAIKIIFLIYFVSAALVVNIGLWGESDDEHSYEDYITGVFLIAIIPLVNTVVVIATAIEAIRDRIKK